jgi:hypothetical protein
MTRKPDLPSGQPPLIAPNRLQMAANSRGIKEEMLRKVALSFQDLAYSYQEDIEAVIALIDSGAFDHLSGGDRFRLKSFLTGVKGLAPRKPKPSQKLEKGRIVYETQDLVHRTIDLSGKDFGDDQLKVRLMKTGLAIRLGIDTQGERPTKIVQVFAAVRFDGLQFTSKFEEGLDRRVEPVAVYFKTDDFGTKIPMSQKAWQSARTEAVALAEQLGASDPRSYTLVNPFMLVFVKGVPPVIKTSMAGLEPIQWRGARDGEPGLHRHSSGEVLVPELVDEAAILDQIASKDAVKIALEAIKRGILKENVLTAVEFAGGGTASASGQSRKSWKLGGSS